MPRKAENEGGKLRNIQYHLMQPQRPQPSQTSDLSLPGRGFLPRALNTSLGPRLRHTPHNNPPTKPTHVHVHEHDIARGVRGKRRVFSGRSAVFVRDGRGDGRPACLDESHCGCFYCCEDERGGERDTRALA